MSCNHAFESSLLLTFLLPLELIGLMVFLQPFIEVLNYPLARHCSNGKTGVLVNRRELHLRDLELLKQRGLPGIPGKSYNLDIDGCLFDAVTGTELPGLGHLAPTYVEVHGSSQ